MINSMWKLQAGKEEHDALSPREGAGGRGKQERKRGTAVSAG